MSSETICAAHYRRTRQRIPAWRVIDGEGMCKSCFRGKPIESVEERMALPFFAALSLARAPLARPSDNAVGRGEPAPRNFARSTASPAR